jgi:hypothetical protein
MCCRRKNLDIVATVGSSSSAIERKASMQGTSQRGHADPVCRLCGGALVNCFSLRVLGKHHVSYLKCQECNSLQTELPFWIHEAYTSNLSNLDTGAGQRNLANLAATYIISRLLRLDDVLDYGGGDGLLCRLLRDYGVNCYVHDKYASPNYAQGFTTPNFTRPQMLLAFEVFEHFENPKNELKELFEMNPDVLLTSIVIFSDQGPDWWYLIPETGQHLFFYSEKALALIARRFGYTLLVSCGYVLFVKSTITGRIKNVVIRSLLRKLPLRIASAAMRLLPTNGVWADFHSLRSNKK